MDAVMVVIFLERVQFPFQIGCSPEQGLVEMELAHREEHKTTIQVVVNDEMLDFYLEEKVRRERYQPTLAEQYLGGWQKTAG